MTGFRTFGPGEKGDFGAMIGVGRLMTGRTLLPGVCKGDYCPSPLARLASLNLKKKKRLVNNQRYGDPWKRRGCWALANEDAPDRRAMATECTVYDGADEQPDVLGEFGCVGITWGRYKEDGIIG